MGIEIVETAGTTILDDALEIIKEQIAEGRSFQTKAMDVFVEALLFTLPVHERAWVKEIAQSNDIPLWQVLMAQFRRNQENSMAQALLLDPDWEAWGVRDQSDRECEFCHKVFTPDHRGQRFCSNRCGGQAELAAKRGRVDTPVMTGVAVADEGARDGDTLRQ